MGAALGQAAKANTQLARVKLQRLMAATKGRNPVELPALGASGPTFTCSAAPAASSTVTLNYNTNSGKFAWYGGPVPDGNFTNYVRSTTRLTAPGFSSWTNRVDWITDEPVFDIEMLGYTAGVSNGLRLMVDGQFVSLTALQPTVNGGANFLNVDWSAVSTAPKRRRYSLQWFGIAGTGFRSLRLTAAGVVEAPSTKDRYRIGVFGDSIPTGVAGTTPTNNGDLRQNAWPVQAGFLLGSLAVDIVQMTIPGTGYITPSTELKFADHLDDLLRQPLDEIWDAGGGVNDSTADLTVLGNAMLALWQGMRQRCPTVPIIVGGVHVNSTTSKAVNLSRETTKLAKFNQWADANSAFIPFQTAVSPPQTSFSDQTGNSARYMNSTGDPGEPLHLVEAGKTYFASFWAEARRNIDL